MLVDIATSNTGDYTRCHFINRMNEYKLKLFIKSKIWIQFMLLSFILLFFFRRRDVHLTQTFFKLIFQTGFGLFLHESAQKQMWSMVKVQLCGQGICLGCAKPFNHAVNGINIWNVKEHQYSCRVHRTNQQNHQASLSTLRSWMLFIKNSLYLGQLHFQMNLGNYIQDENSLSY